MDDLALVSGENEFLEDRVRVVAEDRGRAAKMQEAGEKAAAWAREGAAAEAREREAKMKQEGTHMDHGDVLYTGSESSSAASTNLHAKMKQTAQMTEEEAQPTLEVLKAATARYGMDFSKWKGRPVN